jgi:polar amino acid transport system substrate-binding protein
MPMPIHMLLPLLLLASCLPVAVNAACTRSINVPIAPIGLSVFMSQDGVLSGVYPDLLRKIAQQEGCNFTLSEVPRARLESLFEAGRSDLLVPASRSQRRDALGFFVPLIHSRATVISMATNRPPIADLKDLLARRELRVALVRGFDFGQAYQDMVRELTSQGRVVFERDAASVARLLFGGQADITIMAPSILVGAVLTDPRVASQVDKLQFDAIDELPWGDSGIYISRTALKPEDQQALREQFERASRSGIVWKSFQQYYPASALSGSIKPR